MLPIVLVLLVAASALAAPGARLNIVSINDVLPLEHNGNIISARWTDRAAEIYDGGERSPYETTVLHIINDLANLDDERAQAYAVAQLIAVLGTEATGIPGDACEAAAMIEAYVNYLHSGDEDRLRRAVVKFIHSLSSIIDRILTLATKPDALRFATGHRGTCKHGGRIYRFEAAWDAILANTSHSTAKLMKEQYCAAKRLYNGFSAHSNNAAAFITAASLPPILRIFVKHLDSVARVVSAIQTGDFHPAASNLAKQLSRYTV